MLLVFGLNNLFAQNRIDKNIDFPVGVFTTEPGYNGNSANMPQLGTYLQNTFADNNPTVSSVGFSKLSSPHDKMDLSSQRLHQQANALEQRILSRVEVSNGIAGYHNQHISCIYLESLVHNSDIPHDTSLAPTIRPFYMALKTNVLLGVVAVPSIGIEFYLGKQWSATTNWHYAWWNSHSSSWHWRTYGGDVALRRWFGRKAAEKPLTGHHIGVYAQLLTYDFETGGRGYLGDKWSYGAGIEYGYSLPIGKRINIDFVIGVGYLGGEYEEYLPIDNCYVWQATKNRHWVGPTKAEISIVWLIVPGNTNKRKGGRR